MVDRAKNQFVSTPAVLTLLNSTPASLAEWYVSPLPADLAGSLCLQARQAIQAQLRVGASCFQQRVLLLVCCESPDEVRQSRYDELRQVAADRYENALLELVYGQWLACRKLLPAMHHLSEGFRSAAPLLASDDYFRVLRRHERLASLAFTAQPSSAQDLPELLNEAAVTERLQQDRRRTFYCSRRDTVG